MFLEKICCIENPLYTAVLEDVMRVKQCIWTVTIKEIIRSMTK